jgi:hypothetical protein
MIFSGVTFDYYYMQQACQFHQNLFCNEITECYNFFGKFGLGLRFKFFDGDVPV